MLIITLALVNVSLFMYLRKFLEILIRDWYFDNLLSVSQTYLLQHCMQKGLQFQKKVIY